MSHDVTSADDHVSVYWWRSQPTNCVAGNIAKESVVCEIHFES